MALLVFGMVYVNNVTFAQTQNVLAPVAESILAMNLKDFEKVVEEESTRNIELELIKSKRTFVTGDTVSVKWNYLKGTAQKILILLLNEDVVIAADHMYIENLKQKTADFVISDEIPSGKYFIAILSNDIDPTFDVTKSFKIKTRTKAQKPISIKQKVSDSRNKASNAAAKANLGNARAYGELFYDLTGSYTNVCSKNDPGMEESINTAGKSVNSKTNCDSSALAWAAEVKLKAKEGYFCVDSTGFAQIQNKSKGSSSTGCDGSKDTTKTENKIKKTKNTSIEPEITKDDHFINGSINSKVKVLTYTDLECPYCKTFDATIQRLIERYGNDVAFVYRHYPLSQIHSSAELAANATECIAKLGGEKKFSTYVHDVFQSAPAGLNEDNLSKLARQNGVNEKSFQMCLDKRMYSDEVMRDQTKGNIIAQTETMFGTPYSLVYGPKGQIEKIVGNQPYDIVVNTIDGLLR